MSRFFPKSGFDFQQIGKEVLNITRKSLKQLDQFINEDFDNACKMILSCQGKVIVTGIGKSGHIGKKIAATFASTGTPSFFIHPAEASHGDLGMVNSKDIIIAISNSGESSEILAIIPTLKRFKIRLICLTGRPKSTIARAADIHLCIKVPQEACPLGLAPTSSTTATLVMGDALAVSILKARDFTIEEFALLHPGGAIGRKLLLRVSDIMRTSENIPYVKKEDSIRDALLEMTRKNFGMTAIVDDQMRIQGIFTDRDLCQVFETSINFQQTTIEKVMTPGGMRIFSNMLAIDAFNLMQHKHITSIMVADDDRLIGIVHINDIFRAGIV